MIDENLIAALDIDDTETTELLRSAYGDDIAEGDMDTLLGGTFQELSSADQIITGRIIGIAGDDVVIDVGLKSEGLIDKNEFEDPSELQVGQKVQVLLEDLEGEGCLIQLSKRKSDRLINCHRPLHALEYPPMPYST